LDQSIDPDNEVRMIDLFVDSLSIKDYGFRMDYIENGRPAYHPSDLLKLFIYGYTRNAQDLKKEGSFQEPLLQNITKEIVNLIRRKNASIKDVRL